MFIAEVLHTIQQADLAGDHPGCIEMFSRLSADSWRALWAWKKMSRLSKEDINNVIVALYEYVKAEVARQILDETANKQQKYGNQAGDFIRLILPMKSFDSVERIKVEFLRQDMLARVNHIFTMINMLLPPRIMNEKSDQAGSIMLQKTPTPLDSISVFMQFLNNHLIEGNWQKLSALRNPKVCAEKQMALLSIEYEQCQFVAGDSDYLAYEHKYRSLADQINAERSIGYINHKIGHSPWKIRELLKPGITLKINIEKNFWSWKYYSSLKKEKQ